MTANTQVVPFLAGQMAVPSHIANNFSEEDNNIVDKSSIPQLRFKGKQWSVTMDGEQTVLVRKNTEGEEEPMPVVNVIILDMNPDRSRAYYAGAYDPEKSAAPDCYSANGKVPDADVFEPQCTACAQCPQAAKGSKVHDGKAMVACSSFKRIAVTFAANPTIGPLLLRLPQTSLWDKDNKEQEAKGWYAFDQYLDFLRARGVKNTAAIVTRIKFDPSVDVSYPKLLFSPKDWITAEAVEAVKKVKAEKVDAINVILGLTPAPAAVAALPAPVEVHRDAAPVAPAPAFPVVPTKPKAVAKPKPVAVAVAKPAPITIEIDPDTGDPILPKGAKPAAAPVATAAVAATATATPAAASNEKLNALLSGWDD